LGTPSATFSRAHSDYRRNSGPIADWTNGFGGDDAFI
jgi:hypothetical protein